jgi:hypothetical protein
MNVYYAAIIKTFEDLLLLKKKVYKIQIKFSSHTKILIEKLN